MLSKLGRKKRETPMNSHSQEGLYLQMSKLRDSKMEEEENEAQGQQDCKARGESKQSNMNGRYGKIVKVQGGRIVRSTGKDRHSKVYTTKGTVKDRRIRLAAQTAIDFYDVQDRLGFDRPSKAIKWLMDNAKASIEELGISSTVQQPQNHQGGHAKPETVEVHQHFDESAITAMYNVSKEPVLGFAEEALNYATNFSDADFMEMAFPQSLMGYNYNAGAGGYNAGAGGEGCSYNSSYVS